MDAGVLISVDRHEPRASGAIASLRAAGAHIRTSEPVVAQVWRDGVRQVRLARVLHDVEVHPLDDGRAVGRLLAIAGTSDVVDAHLVLLGAKLGDAIVTGDPEDLQHLADALGPAAPTIHAWP